ncbi:MAG: hypothetical protein Q8936_01710 [Bacillota bacterium]|nr:hypothetical protein [Bacillota bacterium]
MATEMKQPKVRFTHSGSGNYSYSSQDRSFVSASVTNYGPTDLQLNIREVSIIVKSGETFTDTFDDFNSISIVTTSTFRLILRGW